MTQAHGVRTSDLVAAQAGARRLVEDLALVLQASLVVRHCPAPVAEAFVASRLGGARGHTFGTLPPDLVGASGAIIDRAFA